MKTAKKFLLEVAKRQSYNSWYEFNYDTHEEYQLEITKKVLIEFAKMHVEEALKQASNKANADYTKIESEDTIPPTVIGIEVYVLKNSILEAYPLTNIK